MRREIKRPEYADRFFRTDFDAQPMPIISLYPIPAPMALTQVRIDVCGLHQSLRPISWATLSDLPRIKLKTQMICQIFNWSEGVEWEGIRLVDVLDFLKIDTHPEGYYAFHSRDRIFFEGLSRDEARDPRVLLAYALNGEPLPTIHGGPLRLVVPFLQAYKSVKWIQSIYAFRYDPVGTKRLMGQSGGSRLNEEWQKKYPILPPEGKTGDPVPVFTESTPRKEVAEENATENEVLEGSIPKTKESDSQTADEMTKLKEVIAILRPGKHQMTRRALEAAGIYSYTTYSALGRSQQRGLRFQADKKGGAAINFLPKQFFSIVIPEARLSAVIAVLLKSNRTGAGSVGDGRIFVCDVDDAVRISTDERGGEAI